MSGGAVLFIVLIILMMIGVPIGVAIGMSSIAAIVFGSLTLTPTFVAQNLVSGCDSFPIMAIPLFILAGALMGEGGISRRLLSVCDVFFGRTYGGLAIVTVVVCMFFAAISGSGPATVAAVGSMVIPTMLAQGYSKSFSLGLIAAAGSIGIIIPPSIPMVIYGVTTNTSIGDMFKAGFLPGILVGVIMIIFCYLYSKKKGWKTPNPEPFSWKRAGKAIWEAKWALISPIIILGGIYGGFFTPTEAAAVSAIYSLLCGAFLHKELNFKSLMKTIAEACSTTGTTMIIIGCATAFAKILTMEQIPQLVTSAIHGLTDNKILILILINVLLLIVGCFMDTTPAIMVLAPILLPIVTSFGMSPIHFGIIMVVNLAIGYVTPPLGVDLFVAARVGRTKLETVIKGIVPFIVCMIIALLLITYIEPISMLIPNLIH